MTPQSKSVIVQAGIGQEFHLFGDVLSVMLAGEQTDGTPTVMLGTTPPGGGPLPHVHAN
jgi:hypothetical protein